MHLLETHIAAQQKYPIRIQEYAVGIFNTVATKSAIKKAIKKIPLGVTSNFRYYLIRC